LGRLSHAAILVNRFGCLELHGLVRDTCLRVL
jgi:hypothetical protein